MTTFHKFCLCAVALVLSIGVAAVGAMAVFVGIHTL